MKNILNKEAEKGVLVQAVGPIIDVRFLDGYLPPILTALTLKLNEETLVLEVEQHVGDDVCRCIAMSPTDGVKRGMEVINTHKPIEVPVGEATLGRMFNVLGKPIDRNGPFEIKETHSIYNEPPSFADQPTTIEVYETGIKVIDLLCPYLKGGKIRGGSTISQQTAKNVFLWPGRSWVRKGLEAYFTVLIEFMWSKQRIMEVYLNSIEMGPGIYGVQAVAQDNFNKDAAELFRSECAQIAATLPNPLKFSSKNPSAYMLKRRRQIERQMKFIPSFPAEGEDYDPKTSSGGVYSKDK